LKNSNEKSEMGTGTFRFVAEHFNNCATAVPERPSKGEIIK